MSIDYYKLLKCVNATFFHQLHTIFHQSKIVLFIFLFFISWHAPVPSSSCMLCYKRQFFPYFVFTCFALYKSVSPIQSLTWIIVLGSSFRVTSSGATVNSWMIILFYYYWCYYYYYYYYYYRLSNFSFSFFSFLFDLCFLLLLACLLMCAFEFVLLLSLFWLVFDFWGTDRV